MAKIVNLNRILNNNLLGFVPALIMKNFFEGKGDHDELPIKQEIKTIVMFADVSGFTNISLANKLQDTYTPIRNRNSKHFAISSSINPQRHEKGRQSRANRWRCPLSKNGFWNRKSQHSSSRWRFQAM